MEQLRFWDFILSLIGIRKIPIGVSITIIGFVADILSIYNFIPPNYQKYIPLVIMGFLFFGLLLIIIGLFEYSNFLYKKYQEVTAGISSHLSFAESAERIFRDIRGLLARGIATSALKENGSSIKLLSLIRDETGNALMVLYIKGVKEEHIGAQIECSIEEKTKIGKKSSIPVKKRIGLVEISRIDIATSVAYCTMKESDSEDWQDTIDGLKKGRNRTLPDNVNLNPSIDDSLLKFKKQEMKKLHDLLKKFSRF